MLNEQYGGSERLQWKFTYKGKQLLPYGQRRLAQLRADEAQLRERLAGLVKDPASFHDDTRLQRLKAEVDGCSAVREQFEVYCHEFRRAPDKDFVLKLGDLVFFRVHTGETAGDEPEPQED